MNLDRWLPLWRRHDALRFVAVGTWNTAFGYGCFAGLLLLLGDRVHYLVLQALAHFLSVGNAFLWHRRLTFRSTEPWLGEFVRFNVSYLGSLAFGLIALPVLVAGCGVKPLLAGAIVTALATLFSYLLHKRFTFRSNRRASGSA